MTSSLVGLHGTQGAAPSSRSTRTRGRSRGDCQLPHCLAPVLKTGAQANRKGGKDPDTSGRLCRPIPAPQTVAADGGIVSNPGQGTRKGPAGLISDPPAGAGWVQAPRGGWNIFWTQTLHRARWGGYASSRRKGRQTCLCQGLPSPARVLSCSPTSPPLLLFTPASRVPGTLQRGKHVPSALDATAQVHFGGRGADVRSPETCFGTPHTKELKPSLWSAGCRGPPLLRDSEATTSCGRRCQEPARAHPGHQNRSAGYTLCHVQNSTRTISVLHGSQAWLCSPRPRAGTARLHSLVIRLETWILV